MGLKYRPKHKPRQTFNGFPRKRSMPYFHVLKNLYFLEQESHKYLRTVKQLKDLLMEFKNSLFLAHKIRYDLSGFPVIVALAAKKKGQICNIDKAQT